MPGIWSRIVLSVGVAEEQDLTVVSMKNLDDGLCGAHCVTGGR